MVIESVGSAELHVSPLLQFNDCPVSQVEHMPNSLQMFEPHSPLLLQRSPRSLLAVGKHAVEAPKLDCVGSTTPQICGAPVPLLQVSVHVPSLSEPLHSPQVVLKSTSVPDAVDVQTKSPLQIGAPNSWPQ